MRNSYRILFRKHEKEKSLGDLSLDERKILKEF
jgi:hypothetical protein